MSVSTHAFGTIESQADYLVGHLQRHFEHPAPAVWSMLTDSASLPLWLAPGRIEPRIGGTVHIDFADSGSIIDSQISLYAEGYTLAYSWSHPGEPERTLHWQLNAKGDATGLDLHVHIPVHEDVAKACAGFEGHLEMLGAALEGVPIKFPFDLYLAARNHYTQAVTS